MPRPVLLTSKRTALIALVSVAIACLIAATLSTPATARNVAASRGQSLAAQHKAGQLEARLLGSREVPGPGDPNGRGEVTITLKPAAGKVCARATWERIGTPIAAHIHRGAPGVSGPVVIDLTGSVTGGAHCKAARNSLIRKLATHSHSYYYNIHTNAYQAGAIRGQLHHA